jgi:hypothetical protein
MSTKIHNGYRVAGVDAFTLTARLAAALGERYNELYMATVARTAAMYADRLLAGVELPDDAPNVARTSPWMMATLVAEGTHAGIARTGQRNPSHDLQCQVTFLTDTDGFGDMYALLYTEQNAYVKIFESFDEIEPWPYWDNTDRPDDVDEPDWEHRRHIWNRVIGCAAPAQRGLTWSLLGNMHHAHCTAADLVVHLPDRRTRARMLASAFLTVAPDKDATGTTPDLFSELVQRVEQIATDLEPTLPELTVEHLTHIGRTATGVLSEH